MSRVCVVSMPRAGSTMFCDLIEQAGGYVNLCEATNANTPKEAKARPWEDPTPFHTFIRDTVTPHPSCVFKLQHHIGFLSSEYAEDLDLTVVYLERRDTVAGIVSAALARSTKHYMVVQEKPSWSFPSKTIVTPEQAQAARTHISATPGRKWTMAYMAAQLAPRYKARLAAMREDIAKVPDVISLVFEDMVADPGSAVHAILGLNVTPTPRTIRQGDKLNTSLISMVNQILNATSKSE